MSFIISIAMSQRTPSHCVGDRPQRLDDGRPQVGREGVQLHDVGPGGEVRVAAVGEDAAADPDERGRVAREIVLAAARRSTRDAPPSTDGRARRGSARSRGSARARARRAPPARRRGRPARPGAHRPRSRGCSTASRPRPRRRSRAARAGRTRSSPSFSSAIAIPAGLRSQTPISQTASKPSAAIASHSLAGTLAEVDRASRRGGSARRARPTC